MSSSEGDYQTLSPSGYSAHAAAEETAGVPRFPGRLEAYGVVLERMTGEHLEMVREWRTSPEISRYMVYQDPITPVMQQQWFDSLDPQRDLHYIIRYQDVPCGLADVKRIDWAAKTCNGGIFMTPDVWNTEVPIRATFCACDFIFFDLGLEVMLSKVLKTNKRAIRFNLFQGYRILNEEDDASPVYEIRLDKDDYDRATRGFRDFLARRSD